MDARPSASDEVEGGCRRCRSSPSSRSTFERGPGSATARSYASNPCETHDKPFPTRKILENWKQNESVRVDTRGNLHVLSPEPASFNPLAQSYFQNISISGSLPVRPPTGNWLKGAERDKELKKQEPCVFDPRSRTLFTGPCRFKTVDKRRLSSARRLPHDKS
eukprot:727240-Pyramimonas_sp.AAC.2